MKKTSTRLLSLLLALSLLLTLAPAAAAAPAVTAEAVSAAADKTEPDYETSDNWIWSSANAIHNSVSYFRHESDLDGTPTSIKVRVSAHLYQGARFRPQPSEVLCQRHPGHRLCLSGPHGAAGEHQLPGVHLHR